MSTTTAEPNIKNHCEFFVSRWLVTAILLWKWNEQPEYKLLSTQRLYMFTSLATEGNTACLKSYQEQTLILVSHNTV
jgi:nuclear transport factor 2 (NTF2) superfamily protein